MGAGERLCFSERAGSTILVNMLRGGLCVFSLLLVMGCGGDSEPKTESFPELENGCQPLLGGHHCMLPFPSDFFRVEDANTATGFRVAVTGAAANLTDDDVNAELTEQYDTDGFSRIPLIVGALPDVVTADGFVDILSDYAESQSTASKTVIINADTGAFVPHFSDVDPRAYEDDRRAIALHPVVDLEEKTRYVVLLQDVRTEAGVSAEPARGFALLRDSATEGLSEFDGVREHFDRNIFPIIEDAGIDRSGVQLAWDFTTGSDEAPMADMLRMRELTTQWIQDNDISLVVDEVLESPEDKPEIWRRITGHITVPLYLENSEAGAEFARDSEGRVQITGTAQVEFLVHVPVSLRDAVDMGRPLFYGHGFFGSRAELDGELTRVISERLKTVMIAIDWWGMSGPDLVPLIEDLSGDPVRTLRFADRIHQSMSNWIVMTSSLETLASQPELLRPAEGAGSDSGALAGQPLIDVDHGISFMGISQGHILGGMLAAVLPRLDRVVLHVGGAGLSHFMFRAEAFGALLQLISVHFKRPIEQYAWAATTQRIFDRIDPGQYARYILREPLDGASPRRVLMQMGVGDVAVPNFGSYLHARAIGLSAVSNNGLGLFGMPDVAEASSGFASFDYGVDTEFYRAPMVPVEGNDVHDSVRVEAAALEQIDRFLQTDGMVQATCEGACDPG